VHAVLFLLIAAASSTRPVLDALKPELARVAGEPVEIRYGSTGALAREIEKGVPYDLFFAADEVTPEALARANLVDRLRITRVGLGRLAVVLGKGVKLDMPLFARETASSFRKGSFRKLALASPRTSPNGRAAEEALLSTLLLNELRPRIVYAESSAAALQLVTSGEADVGLVAASLVTPPPPGLRVIPVEMATAPRRDASAPKAGLHLPILHTVTVVSATKKRDAADRVLDAAAAATEVWQRFGFAPP